VDRWCWLAIPCPTALHFSGCSTGPRSMESPRAWVAIRTLSSHPDRRGNRRLPPSCRVEIPGAFEFDDGETFSIQRPQAEHLMENGFCLAAGDRHPWVGICPSYSASMCSQTVHRSGICLAHITLASSRSHSAVGAAPLLPESDGEALTNLARTRTFKSALLLCNAIDHRMPFEPLTL